MPSLLKTLPHFLGPVGQARIAADRRLVAAVRRHGGRMPTTALQPVCAACPWLKAEVGNLRAFCAGHAELAYHARAGASPAYLSLRAHHEDLEIADPSFAPGALHGGGRLKKKLKLVFKPAAGATVGRAASRPGPRRTFVSDSDKDAPPDAEAGGACGKGRVLSRGRRIFVSDSDEDAPPDAEGGGAGGEGVALPRGSRECQSLTLAAPPSGSRGESHEHNLLSGRSPAGIVPEYDPGDARAGPRSRSRLRPRVCLVLAAGQLRRHVQAERAAARPVRLESLL